ncbi:MAG TPA: hypothetical protein PLW09_02625 [Candidatus Kapabacteria bacterium]|nr:hypothetical protein [Candidatus Kapabacteria bacterium]
MLKAKMQKIKDIQRGDVLSYKANDDKYKVLLCIRVDKERSPHCYWFAALTYDAAERPSIEDVCESNFYGTGNSRSESYAYSADELENMWSWHPEIKPYFLGAYSYLIWRKDFMSFRDKIELLGNLSIVEHLEKHSGRVTNASSWTFLSDDRIDRYKTNPFGQEQKTFKVKAILRL